MFSVFLMMINIIHNRISLTHNIIISVHSHRGHRRLGLASAAPAAAIRPATL